jgi:hypothetical protein
MSKDTSAFPEVKTEVEFNRDCGSHFSNTFSHGGLTKRELYAGLAMQGYLAGNHRFLEEDRYQQDSAELLSHVDLVVRCAVKFADALIAELEK